MSLELNLSVIHDNVYIIFAAMAVSLMLLIVSVILHFRQHFKCQTCYYSSSSSSKSRIIVTSTSNLRPRTSSLVQIATSVKDSRFRCLCGTHDDDDFDFFPMAFLIYLILILLLCLLLLTRFIIVYINDSWHESLLQIIVPSIDNLLMISISFDIFPLSNTEELMIIIIDYIVVYFMLFMSLMESLFNFYRYYTTIMTTKKLKLVTTTDVILKYLLYFIIFFLLYACVIHVYFWLFPIIILLHCIFGIYCSWHFASTLIKSYTNFIGLGPSVSEANQHVLNSVYFMRKISLICTLIQSIYLCIFMLIYYINFNLVIIYVPILWSIASFLFALNFVRNREAIHHTFRCTKKESPTPLQEVKTVSSGEQDALTGRTETQTTAKQVSFNTITQNTPKIVSCNAETSPNTVTIAQETTPKHLSLNIETPPKQITSPHLKNVPVTMKKHAKKVSFNPKDVVADVDSKARATSDSGLNTMQIMVTKALQPVPIDLTIMPKYNPKPTMNAKNSQNSPNSDKDSPYTPSSASLQNLAGHKNHAMFLKDQDTMRSYMQSVEFTQQMSAGLEMSVFTETDAGGRKLEEYNKYLAANSKLQNDLIMPSPQLNAINPTDLKRQNTAQEMSVSELAIGGEHKKQQTLRVSEKKHTLDPIQLALQLSLLKKFGFNVRRIQKSLK